MTTPSFLDLVADRVVVYDGATGTWLQTQGLTADDYGGDALEGCTDLLGVTRPDVIAALHSAYFEVGADVVETNTFGAFAVPLGEYDLAERSHEIALANARIAREVADSFSTADRKRYVAGSLGPGTKAPSLAQIRFAELRDAYEVAARGLLEGGVDLFILETHFDLLALKASVIGARRAMAAVGRQVPIQAQVTMELTGRMLVGTEIAAALTAIEPLDVDIIGLNCATGPTEMSEHVRHLSQHSRVPISVLPNAGLPRWSTARCTTTSRPSRWRPISGASSRSTACRSSEAAAAPPPSSSGCWPTWRRTSRRPPAPPRTRRRWRRSTRRSRSTRTPRS